jgi:chromosome segregation ATPase
MQSGNGIDLAAIYRLLTEVAEKVAAHDRRFDQIDRRFEQIDRRFGQIDRRFDQVAEVLNNHSRKIDDLSAGVGELRASLHDYHEAVIGHGLHTTDLDKRVGRIEEHLGLDPSPPSAE